MLLFKRNKNKTQEVPGWYVQVSHLGKATGHRLSDYLQSRTSNLSPSRLKIACLTFILLAGGGSAWVMMNGLLHPSPIMQVVPIRQPSELPSRDPENFSYDAITRASIYRIEKFRLLMDSLKNDPEGRRFYDSIRRARPGLFDSINKVEQLYKPPSLFSK